ncbi:hypothetical protein U9M48_020009 [Paspalum notatum var. saurae]|uniref:Uncharacterized protein n=1 Tax=Paspalum notatum var. saurae TaxID=547442 RepID=A0AAQ3TEP7_PASNO
MPRLVGQPPRIAMDILDFVLEGGSAESFFLDRTQVGDRQPHVAGNFLVEVGSEKASKEDIGRRNSERRDAGDGGRAWEADRWGPPVKTDQKILFALV